VTEARTFAVGVHDLGSQELAESDLLAPPALARLRETSAPNVRQSQDLTELAQVKGSSGPRRCSTTTSDSADSLTSR
jgi:hypothetical protein